MDSSKENLTIKIGEGIVFLFLILFPFGQTIRTTFSIFSVSFPFHPIDLAAGLSIPVLFFVRPKLPKITRYIFNFLLVAAFSYLLSLIIFQSNQSFLGGLYLLRLFSFASFFLLVRFLVSSKKKLKGVFSDSLVSVAVIAGLFGWVQYFFYPDIRPLVVWGWDDHLFRLVGTFLDPGFISIILVMGFLLTFSKFLSSKKKFLIFVLVFLFSAISFTYSRAGYLALIAGIFTILYLKNKINTFFPLALVFLMTIFILPRPSGEGVKLERTFSVYARLNNYQETIKVWQRSPLFGVGFNNLCLARQKYLGRGDLFSHSCSGSDASLLLVLATTGIVGLISFLHLLFRIPGFLNKSVDSLAFKSTLSAVFVHSLFVNSLFYPWVMGFMAILLALSLKEDS